MPHRLGLGAQFWNGDIDAAYRHQLAPTGVTLEQLRANPGGVRVPLQTRHAKYAEPDTNGTPRGFATPSRKVELYSQTFLDHGYAPLPDFEEPPIGPVARPDLAARFPLVLTSAKATLFCQSQHRALPSLRKRAPYPEVELHPAAAQARGIANGDWVSIETPEGSVRARARLNDNLDPRVVVGEHGWWQACAEIGAPGYDPFGPLAPTSTCLSARRRSIRSAARRRTAPICARSDGPPNRARKIRNPSSADIDGPGRDEGWLCAARNAQRRSLVAPRFYSPHNRRVPIANFWSTP